MAFARRLFADNGWPVIDVSRRSIEETAAAIIKLYTERQTVRRTRGPTRYDRSEMIVLLQRASRRTMLGAAGVEFEVARRDRRAGLEAGLEGAGPGEVAWRWPKPRRCRSTAVASRCSAAIRWSRWPAAGSGPASRRRR